MTFGIILDRYGGVVLGLLIGVASSGAVIIGIAKLTYEFDAGVISGVVLGDAAGELAKIGGPLSSDAGSLSGVVPEKVAADLAEAAKSLGLDPSLLSGVVTGEVAGELTQTGESLGPLDSIKQSLETALLESRLVPYFFRASEALPGDVLSYIPSEFKTALDTLKERIG